MNLSFDLNTIEQTLNEIRDTIEENFKLVLDIEYGICDNEEDIEKYLKIFNDKFEKFVFQYGHQVNEIHLKIVELPLDFIEINLGLEYQLNFISNFKFFTLLENFSIHFEAFSDDWDEPVSDAILNCFSQAIPNPGGMKRLNLNLNSTNFSKLINHEYGNFDVYSIQDSETNLLNLIQRMNSLQSFSIEGNYLSTYFMDNLNIYLQNLNSLQIVSLKYHSTNGDLAPIYTILRNTNIHTFEYILSGPIELGAKQIPSQEQLPNSYTRPYQNFENIITEMEEMIRISNLHRFPESNFPSISLNLQHAFEDDKGLGLKDTTHSDSFITNHFLHFLECLTRMQLKTLSLKLPEQFQKRDQDVLILIKKLIKTNALTFLNVSHLERKKFQIGEVCASFAFFRLNYIVSFFNKGILKHRDLAYLDNNYQIIVEKLPKNKVECLLKDLRLVYLLQLFKILSSSSYLKPTFIAQFSKLLSKIEFNASSLMFSPAWKNRNIMQQIPGNIITDYLVPVEQRNLLVGFGGGPYTQLFRNLFVEAEPISSTSVIHPKNK